MSDKKKVVTIVRSKWARGKQVPHMPDEEYTNSLRNPDGSQCCLGFVCRALGFKVRDIAGAHLPSWVFGDVPEWLITLEDDASNINDAVGKNSRDREKELKRLFADTPIALKFVP